MVTQMEGENPVDDPLKPTLDEFSYKIGTNKRLSMLISLYVNSGWNDDMYNV